MSASSHRPAAISQALIAQGTFSRRSVPPAERRAGQGARACRAARGYSRADRSFRRAFSHASGQPLRKLAEDAVAVLQTQDWPGNVRQLRNNVERMMILAGGEPASEITAAMLPAGCRQRGAGGGQRVSAASISWRCRLREAREAFERDYLAAQLSRFGGNISRTANFVGMERSALHRKIKLLGLTSRGEPDDVGAPAAAAG